MHKENEDGEVVTHLNKVEARGGSRTTLNRNVLVASIILVVIVLAIVVGSGVFETDRTGADTVNADNSARNEMVR
jgi:hypothetical protein